MPKNQKAQSSARDSEAKTSKEEARVRDEQAKENAKSPTKISEARAKKNADLSNVDTDVEQSAKTEAQRATIPVNQRPEDRIR